MWSFEHKLLCTSSTSATFPRPHPHRQTQSCSPPGREPLLQSRGRLLHCGIVSLNALPLDIHCLEFIQKYRPHRFDCIPAFHSQALLDGTRSEMHRLAAVELTAEPVRSRLAESWTSYGRTHGWRTLESDLFRACTLSERRGPEVLPCPCMDDVPTGVDQRQLQ